jgi:anti-sigma regulatory factor (Ser/Thr protein kinase)
VVSQPGPDLAEDDMTLLVPLPFAPGAVPHARAVVGERVAGFPDRLIADAELLTSEVVSNAVMHGAPPLRLGVTTHADGVRVEVLDGSDVLPRLPTGDVHPDSPGGRGLRIVDALASAWGVEAGTDGKTVWFHVTSPERGGSAARIEHEHQKEEGSWT